MPYDVFLSYNSSDKAAVRELAQALRARGLNPWLDEDESIPGRRWQKALEDIILSARAVAVLIGPNGLGPWHENEMEACLRRCAREELPIIPVLLPGASAEPELPVFLNAFTWVDMRNGFSTVELARLEWGISGKKPGDATGSPPTRHRFNNPIADELARAVRRREELERLGVDTKEARKGILDLKRKLRDGGQLKPGDILQHGEEERYTLLAIIGQGGFATVWQACDRSTGKDVAIKILHGQYARDKSRRNRFFEGARVMAHLDHEAIVRVLVPHSSDGTFHYFVMEFINGINLKDAILCDNLEAEDVIPLIVEIGAGLANAHDRGFIHRDVKPSNIIIDTAGHAKLTDFDLVTGDDITGGTRSGAMGTLRYSAPELLERPQTATLSADIYGLAMTMLFALLRRELPAEVIRNPNLIVASVQCNNSVANAIKRALSWKPEDRYQDIRLFCHAIQADPTITDFGNSSNLGHPANQQPAPKTADSAEHTTHRTLQIAPPRTPTSYRRLLVIMMMSLVVISDHSMRSDTMSRHPDIILIAAMTVMILAALSIRRAAEINNNEGEARLLTTGIYAIPTVAAFILIGHHAAIHYKAAIFGLVVQSLGLYWCGIISYEFYHVESQFCDRRIRPSLRMQLRALLITTPVAWCLARSLRMDIASCSRHLLSHPFPYSVETCFDADGAPILLVIQSSLIGLILLFAIWSYKNRRRAEACAGSLTAIAIVALPLSPQISPDVMLLVDLAIGLTVAGGFLVSNKLPA